MKPTLPFIARLIAFLALVHAADPGDARSARQSDGPTGSEDRSSATLGGPQLGDAVQEPAAVASEEREPLAMRPTGTVTRPKDGVKHPDLDKAWDEYDAAVTRITDSIRLAISKQFHIASTKGHLGDAEKWHRLGEAFEKQGTMPTPSDATVRASSAAQDFSRAREGFAKAGMNLQKAYEEITQSLTRDKKILDARAVNEEWNHLRAGFAILDELRQQEPISLQKAKSLAARVLSLSEQDWQGLPGAVFTVSAHPKTPCDTGIVLAKDDRYCFLPCPTDRWNTSPGRWQDTDFRGHDRKELAANGMPHMRLCYMLDNGPPRYVLEAPVIAGMEGSLRFVPSDISGGGDSRNNTGFVRVKVMLAK